MEKQKIVLTTEQQIRLIVADELRKMVGVLKAEIAEEVCKKLASDMRAKGVIRQ